MRSLRWGAFVSWLIVAGLAIGGFAAFSPRSAQPNSDQDGSFPPGLGTETGRVVAIAFAAASVDRTSLTAASTLPQSVRPTVIPLNEPTPDQLPSGSTLATVPITVTWPSGSSCLASWYGPGFEGKSTASGEPFDPSAMTGALHDVRIGTRVTVTRSDTGASVVIRVNDRGPYEWRDAWYRHPTRCVDLSEAAMEALGGIGSGLIPVTISY